MAMTGHDDHTRIHTDTKENQQQNDVPVDNTSMSALFDGPLTPNKMIISNPFMSRAFMRTPTPFKQAMDRIKLKEEQLERLKASGQYVNDQFGCFGDVNSHQDCDIIDYDTRTLLNSLCDSGYYEDIMPLVQHEPDHVDVKQANEKVKTPIKPPVHSVQAHTESIRHGKSNKVSFIRIQCPYCQFL